MKSLIDTILFQRTPVFLQQTTTAKGNILDTHSSYSLIFTQYTVPVFMCLLLNWYSGRLR